MVKHGALLALGAQLAQVYAKLASPLPRATSAPALAKRATAISVDLTTTYQEIDGFGTSEAFGRAEDIENASATAQQQALDLLFDATTGAGLTILRNRIGNGGTGDSIEPTAPTGGTNTSAPTYVWDDDDAGQVFVTTKALAYGNLKYIYADAWGAPAFMKTNDDESNGGYLCGVTGETCSTGDWRQAYANFIAQYIQDYASIGITVTHVGFLNEPEFAASYSSMLSSGQQAADFIEILYPTLQAAGLDTLIACCDSEGWDNQKTMTAGIISAGVEDQLGIITSHSYTSQPDGPITTSRKVWQTEYADLSGTWNTNWYSSGIIGEGFYWAQLIQNDLVNSNLSAYLYWEGAEADATVNSHLISIGTNSSVASGRLWALGHFARYVRPGALRVATTSGLSTLTTSAFTNTDGTLSVQVVNAASTAASITLLTSGKTFGSAVAWVSEQSNLGEIVALNGTTISGGEVSASVPAYSLVTFVLSGTGTGSSTSSTSSTSKTSTSTTATTTSPPSSSAPATQSEYGQCGGSNYSGATACASPYACSTLNAYYAQCL